jgi:hypothetical protein
MKWFKHDADMHQNRKIRKLIRTHGATGYAFWCVLLEKIYSAEGNFQIPADDLWFEDIAEDLKLGDYRTPIRILDTLSELGLISTQLWQDHVIAIPSVVERGDQYLVKRASEAEKKRGQRAKKAQLSLGDKAGTKGQKAEMSPSDTDPYSDSDSESYLETEEKNKNLDLNIDPPEADFSPPWLSRWLMNQNGQVSRKWQSPKSMRRHSKFSKTHTTRIGLAHGQSASPSTKNE